MLRLGDVPRRAVRAGLRRGLFRLHIGAVSLRITSALPEVAEGLARVYGHYGVSVAGGEYDLDLEIAPAVFWRRWVRRNALFRLSGQAPFLPMPAHQAHALFEWGLNWAVGTLSHQFLILHSAVVEKAGRAVLLAATSGSGKSTLTAELVMRGWRLFSDEIALIGEASMLTPFPRPVSLKNQSIGLLRERHPGAVFGPVAEDTQKGTIAHLRAPDDSVDRARETAPASLVVFPRWAATSSLRVSPVGQGQAAMRLVDQSFNYSILGGLGFSRLADLVQRAEAWDLEYSSLDDAAAALDDLVADHG